MIATEQELQRIRCELERQEHELSLIEAAATRHGDVAMHIGDEVQEQLESISFQLKRRATPRVNDGFVVRV